MAFKIINFIFNAWSLKNPTMYRSKKVMVKLTPVTIFVIVFIVSYLYIIRLFYGKVTLP